jgi:hypothetical protein
MPVDGSMPSTAPYFDGSNPFTTEAGYPSGSCPVQCGQPFGNGHAFTSMADVVATLRGRWLYCSGSPLGMGVAPPTNVVGVEFTDVAVFWLVSNSSGEVVRGTGPDYAMTLSYRCNSCAGTCFDPYGHFSFDDDFHGSLSPITWAGALSDCPREMRIGYATSEEGQYAAIP